MDGKSIRIFLVSMRKVLLICSVFDYFMRSTNHGGFSKDRQDVGIGL